VSGRDPKTPPRVVVAHPGRQHSHQTALGFQEGGMLERYLTPVWFEPGRWPYPLLRLAPAALRGALVAQLRKRSFRPLDGRRVETYPAWKTLGLLARRFDPRSVPLGRRQHREERRFDRWTARRLGRLEFDAFVGYEVAALESFRACRARGRRTVLDLAGVHWKLQARVFADDHPAAGAAVVASTREIQEVKQRELEAADLILTPSAFGKRALLDAGIEEERIREIPYGVDLSLFRPKDTYRREGRLVALFVGSIVRRKGVRHLLAAMAPSRGFDAELVLVGSAAGGQALLRAFPGRYRHVPFLLPEALVDYYHQADVLVLPSLLDSFGLVALEAMACGTPVLVTDHAGAKDVVREGVDGFVVPHGSAEALAERLRLLSADRERVERMGREARRRAEAFPWELYRSRVRDAVLELVGGGTCRSC
jgi:glycosyltransferase involved in cell wall biosynthesis